MGWKAHRDRGSRHDRVKETRLNRYCNGWRRHGIGGTPPAGPGRCLDAVRRMEKIVLESTTAESTGGRTATISRMSGHVVVEELIEYGVDTVFAVPGESYLAVLDGLYEHQKEIHQVTARHEGGAAMMAAAYGRTTGRPGVCMVTRGPGATNASIGVHVAAQDASPMLLLVGQIPEANRERVAFQEVDYAAFFGSVAKAVIQILSPDRTAEQMSRALSLTTSGEPGPVVVVLPEDTLTQVTASPVVRSTPPTRPIPSPDDIDRAVELLSAAERPAIIAGRCNWTLATSQKLRAVAETSQIPVVTAVRCQDVIDNRSEAYVGTLGLNTTPGLPRLLEEADLVVFLGTRPDALSMGDFSMLTPPRAQARIIHIYPDADVFGRVYATDLGIPVSPEEFLLSLPDHIDTPLGRSEWLHNLRSNDEVRKASNPADEMAADYMQVFNEIMPADTITTAGAGNYTAWQQRHRRFEVYPSQLASQSGAMGYGIPAGVAAAYVYRDRKVVSFSGDGCFMMTGQELATAALEELDLMVILINNSRFGTIRDHQDRHYPGRVSGTDLHNPDFTTLGRAYGARTAVVDSVAEFRTALEQLRDQPGLRLIEVTAP